MLEVLLKVCIWCRRRINLSPFAPTLPGCPFLLSAVLEHLLGDDVEFVLHPVLVCHAQSPDVGLGPYSHPLAKAFEAHLERWYLVGLA